ncbi:tsf, partial [Cucurbita argyrosperma subsp. argyrosperma]
MSVISPSSISNVSLVPIASYTRKSNSSTRFSFSRKPTKHTLHSQGFLLPLSSSVRLFPNCSKNFFCNHGRRIPILSATGTDVSVEESDSPVPGEELNRSSELSSAIATNEKDPVKSDAGTAAPTQSKRSRPVRKSEMPAVNNEELIPGATFTGKVRSIQPFGAFVDFGAFTDGLVHVSRLSDSFVKDVASVVSVGQEVKVRLIEANAETGRISLSMRESDERKESSATNDKPAPGRKTSPKARGPKRDGVQKSSKFVKGQDLQGTVKNITRSGAFISLPEGEEGFLPNSEEAFEGFGNLMGGSTLEIGQEVDVRVLRIARGQVTLTMKKEEDNQTSDSQVSQGKVFAATNPFLLAFRKNKDIATFLDERENVKEVATKSVVQKVTEIVEGIVDADQTVADDSTEAIDEAISDDKEEESLPSIVDEAVEVDEPASSADSSAVTQDDSESILSTSEHIVDDVVDAEDKEAEQSPETKASDDNQLAIEQAADKPEVLDDPSSDALITQDEGESTISRSENIVDSVTDTTEKEAGGSSEVKASEDEQPEEVQVVEAAQPINRPETDEKVIAPDDETNNLVSSESPVSEDSVVTEKESEESQEKLENEIVSASSSEKEGDKPESDSNGSITNLGQSSEEVAENPVDIQAPAENPEVLSSTPVTEEKIEASPEVASKAVISPALVKQLRDETGAGMMDCKKALAESGGDIAKAQEFLRKKGLASAEKKASRATAEGRIGSYIHDGRIGVLIEVNCETDFVSRGDIFKELVDDLAMQVAACPQVQYVMTEDVPEEMVNKEREVEMQKEDLLSKPEQMRSRIVEGRIGKRLEELALLEQPYIKNDKVVLKDWVKQTIATIGENIKVKRFVRFNLGEGLEKKSQDFAAEVAAQTAAKPAVTTPVEEEKPGVDEAKETVPKTAAVAVPAALVKKLREETGAGMMDCKKALSETGGDLEKAQEYLRKKGLSSADKKSSRLAAEGRIGSYIHDSRIGVLIEVNCETDFVGRNERFKELVDDLAMQIVACPEVQYVSMEDIPESIVKKEREIELQREDLQKKPENIREKIVDGRISKRLGELVLLEQPFIKDDSILVKDLVKQTVASLGENIKVRRFVRFTIGETVADSNE